MLATEPKSHPQSERESACLSMAASQSTDQNFSFRFCVDVVRFRDHVHQIPSSDVMRYLRFGYNSSGKISNSSLFTIIIHVSERTATVVHRHFARMVWIDFRVFKLLMKECKGCNIACCSYYIWSFENFLPSEQNCEDTLVGRPK